MTTAAERFWQKVDKRDDDECWPWLGRTNWKGYGSLTYEGQTTGAHRVAYRLTKGEIPEGLTIDHLCRNRACVNPAHLEPVSNRTNVLRGEGITAENATKTHCVHGHEFTPENTDWRAGKAPHLRERVCKTCRRRRWRDRERADRIAEREARESLALAATKDTPCQ